MECILLKAEMK